MRYKKYHPRIALAAAIAAMLAACNAADPKLSGNDAGFRVTPVTPAVVAQLQNEQSEKYHPSVTAICPLEPEYNYRLGPGDILFAKLYLPSNQGFDGSTTERYSQYLSMDSWQEYNEVIVKDDGNVSFPYVGEMPFANKTLSEAKEMLDMALAKYFKHPQSVLEVKEFKSRKVQVTGELHKPGEQYLRFAPLHVLEAVDAAGGLLDSADTAVATLTHKDGSIDKIDLFALMNNGDTSQNRILWDGDTLNIPANYGNKIFVMGEVSKPSMQYIKAGHMTIMEALNNASQGVNPITASYSNIYVIRENAAAETAAPLQTQVYHLDGSTGSGLAMAAQFPLEPNDVVYVSPTGLSEWNEFINQLLPTGVIYTGATITNNR